MMDWNINRFEDVYDPESCQPSEQRFVGDYFYAGFKPTDHKLPSEPIEEWYWQQWISRQKKLVRTELPQMCQYPSVEPHRLAVEPAERMGLMSAEKKRNRTMRCGEPLFGESIPIVGSP